MLTAKIRAQVQEAYQRAPNLEYRIRYVNEFIFARARFKTQTFPLPTDIVRQLKTVLSWFLWEGEIFRVLLSTLELPEEEGGRGLINIVTKYMTLCMLRMEEQGRRKSIFTANSLKFGDNMKNHRTLHI